MARESQGKGVQVWENVRGWEQFWTRGHQEMALWCQLPRILYSNLVFLLLELQVGLFIVLKLIRHFRNFVLTFFLAPPKPENIKKKDKRDSLTLYSNFRYRDFGKVRVDQRDYVQGWGPRDLPCQFDCVSRNCSKGSQSLFF